MQPRARLALLAACAVALAVLAALLPRPPDDGTPTDPAPVEDAGVPPGDASRPEGPGEPDEVHEDVEGPPVPGGKG
jgi:hypothetical protein